MTSRTGRAARSIARHSLTPVPASLLLTSLLLSGCVVEAPRRVVEYEAPPPVRYAPPPPVAYAEPAPQAVVSVYVDPPIGQPAPIGVAWAPPPMLVEVPPPQPFEAAVWIGGYWVWQGDWVWASGRWVPPPHPGYRWFHPYYEHRDRIVVFIGGHWGTPDAVFLPPPPTLQIVVMSPGPGVRPGPEPIGPQGCFVPPPPGSRHGMIIPAPVGTPPAVVVSAPPVVNVGMRVQQNVGNTSINNSVTNNNVTNVTNNVTNITNITRVTNVTIVASAQATANGQAYSANVPAQAHLAAALPSVVQVAAPKPVSAQPIPAFVANRPLPSLPPPQTVRASAPPPATASPRPLVAPANAGQLPPSLQTSPGVRPPAVPSSAGQPPPAMPATPGVRLPAVPPNPGQPPAASPAIAQPKPPAPPFLQQPRPPVTQSSPGEPAPAGALQAPPMVHSIPAQPAQPAAPAYGVPSRPVATTPPSGYERETGLPPPAAAGRLPSVPNQGATEQRVPAAPALEGHPGPAELSAAREQLQQRAREAKEQAERARKAQSEKEHEKDNR